MDTLKAICLHLLVGASLTLLGSLILMVVSSAGYGGE